MQSLRVHQFYYARGMMTLTFSFVVNTEGATLIDACENSAGRKDLTQLFKKLIVDARYCYQVILTFQNYNEPQLTRVGISVRNHYRSEGRDIKTAEAIKLRKVGSTTNAIV